MLPLLLFLDKTIVLVELGLVLVLNCPGEHQTVDNGERRNKGGVLAGSVAASNGNKGMITGTSRGW